MDQDCSGGSDYDADLDSYDSDQHGGSDCNDASATVFPGALDVFYDGVDADCAGNLDYDADGDGHDSDQYGGDDCNDSNALVSPSETEVWYDGVDQDCAVIPIMMPTPMGTTATVLVEMTVTTAISDISPSATEVWYDGIDQDCAGDSDYDADGDGFDSDQHGGTDCRDQDSIPILLHLRWLTVSTTIAMA